MIPADKRELETFVGQQFVIPSTDFLKLINIMWLIRQKCNYPIHLLILTLQVIVHVDTKLVQLTYESTKPFLTCIKCRHAELIAPQSHLEAI